MKTRPASSGLVYSTVSFSFLFSSFDLSAFTPRADLVATKHNTVTKTHNETSQRSVDETDILIELQLAGAHI